MSDSEESSVKFLVLKDDKKKKELTATQIASVAIVGALLIYAIGDSNLAKKREQTTPQTRQSVATDAACPHPVSKTSSPAQIRFLQRQLRNQGADITVDGSLGPETLAALRQFQTTHRIPVKDFAHTREWRTLGLC